MKKSLLLLVMLCTSYMGIAQDKPTTTQEEIKLNYNVIKSNPLYAVAGWLPVSYERFFGAKKNKSFMINLNFITNPMINLGSSYPYDNRRGYYINPTMRFYLYKIPKFPGGFYIAPEAAYASQTWYLDEYTIQSYDASGALLPPTVLPAEHIQMNTVEVSATTGYQFAGKYVVADFYIGQGISMPTYSGDTKSFFNHAQLSKYVSKDPLKDHARLLWGVKVGIPF